MTRQIDAGFRAPSAALLEERILQLETKVALLTHAVQALTRELEEQAEA
ncbi:MAG: hypothetical protein ACRDP6_32685 [Actinoallomurus sp.]